MQPLIRVNQQPFNKAGAAIQQPASNFRTSAAVQSRSPAAAPPQHNDHGHMVRQYDSSGNAAARQYRATAGWTAKGGNKLELQEVGRGVGGCYGDVGVVGRVSRVSTRILERKRQARTQSTGQGRWCGTEEQIGWRGRSWCQSAHTQSRNRRTSSHTPQGQGQHWQHSIDKRKDEEAAQYMGMGGSVERVVVLEADGAHGHWATERQQQIHREKEESGNACVK